ncbi:MAG: GAF domain-containing protein [Elusimicrobia bacterium]|nr:GAF domain-containing protein [Elusimicrobiota bacterium]
MNWSIFSALLGSVFSFLIGLLVYLRNKKGELNRSFFFMNISISLWNLADILIITSKTNDIALVWDRIAYVGAFFIAPFFAKLIFTFTDHYEKRSYRRLFYCLFAVGGFLSVMSISTPLIIKSVTRNPFTEEVGIIYPVFVLYFLGGLVYSLIVLFRSYLQTTAILKKTQFLYIFLALAVGSGAVVIYFITIMYPDFPKIHYMVEILYLIIFAYAIVKLHIMDISVAVTRWAIFSIVYLPFLTVPIFVAISGEQYFRKVLGPRWWIALFVVGVILTYISHIVNYYLREKAESRLLHEQRRYHESLLKASKNMIFIRDLVTLREKVVDILIKEIKISHVRFFAYDTQNKEYRLIASRGIERRTQTGRQLNARHPMIKLLNREQKAILSENLQRIDYSHYKLNIDLVEEELRALGASLIVPNIVHNRLLGFISLGTKQNKKIYTGDDISVLSTLSNQVALAMENAEFYEKIKDQEATLLQSFKLTTLGEMAAGFAHQINNPLSGILLSAGYFRRTVEKVLKDKTEKLSENMQNIIKEAKETLMLIEQRAEHAGKIVTDIMRFSKQEDLCETDIAKVIDDGVSLIPSKKFTQLKIKLVKNVPGDLPKVKIRPVDIEQVIMNLCTNALEAMEHDGVLTIEADIDKEKQDFLRVEVSDTGHGITEENMNKIFDFFFTTKGSKGLGLGLALTYKMVKNNNGEIEVESTPGKGTKFSIYLPLYKESQAA